MTIANTFAAKLSVAFVAIAMALSMVAPAQAQTAEELQAQIDSLMATIAALQAQAGMTSPTASGNAYVFTRSLTIGSQGADVTALQNYLIGANIAIPAGATGYFGAQTQAAVASWQSANGVMPAAGYFGPVSQAKYNALMAAMPDDSDDSDDSTDDSDDSTDDSDDSSDVSLSGEASLSGDEDLNDGDDTNIEEGQEAAPVAEFEVEFENGDAVINRIDVDLNSGDGEEDAWDTFEEVSLWVDGEEVATMSASDEDDYLSDERTLRFGGLDIVSMEDETTVVTIAVTVQGSVDDLSATWDVDVTEIRFTDADDVTSTEDPEVDSTNFVVDEEGSDDELIVKTSSEDLDSTTLIVEDDTTSDMMTIFAFDLDTDDSTNDIALNNIVVSLETDDDAITDVVNDVQLVIDGETFDDFAWDDETGAVGRVNFDIDGDYAIEAGERVTVEVQVEFKKTTDNYAEGATIQATTTSAVGYDAEGATDLTIGDNLTGSASGETHVLRTGGLLVEYVSDETTNVFTADDSGEADKVKYEVTFEVTALEEDMYLDRTVTRDDATAGGAAGAGFMWATTTDSTTGTTSTAIVSADDSDSQDTDTQFFVAEGETREFTLSVTLTAGIPDGVAGVKLTAVNWDVESDDATPDNFHTTGLEDFNTDTEALGII